MPAPQYILVVNHIVSSVFKSVEEIRREPRFKNLEILLITNNPDLAPKYKGYIDPDKVINCAFTSREEIKLALEPYICNIVGVICRGDKHIQYLRKIIPLLKNEVLAATDRSLEISTDKGLMRQSFLEHYPQISPKYLEITKDSDESIQKIESELGYPLIVKPANLFSSLLIQSCSDRKSLQTALKRSLDFITSTYEKENINEKPAVIVEQFLDGYFYSTDVFVMEKGDVYCTPLVGYVSAKQIGVDDFSLYKRFTPTELSDDDKSRAFKAAKKAIDAVGLTHSAAHVELVKTSSGWKIIELGPRLGRFRNIMYRLSYGIDLSLNDLKIHLGVQPQIKDSLKQYCSAYSIYPAREGALKKIVGLDTIEKSPLVKSLRLLASPGQKCFFAKNGGHALAEFIFASPDEQEYREMVEYVEENIYAEVD